MAGRLTAFRRRRYNGGRPGTPSAEWKGPALIFTPLACLAFLLPPAVYCLILARWNRARRPVLVPGPWDFAGVLFAISGFVLFGGPCLLTGLGYGRRDLWLQLRARLVGGHGDQWWYLWLCLWACYFALVLGGSVLLLWRRRNVLSVYNVEPAVLDQALAGVLDKLGLAWTRARGRIFIGFRLPAAEGALARRAAVTVPPEVSVAQLDDEAGAHGPSAVNGVAEAGLHDRAVLELDAFPAMRHVSLRWPGDPGPVRAAVEGELGRALEEVQTPHNPAGIWLLALGLFLSAVALASFLAVFVTLAVQFLRQLG